MNRLIDHGILPIKTPSNMTGYANCECTIGIGKNLAEAVQDSLNWISDILGRNSEALKKEILEQKGWEEFPTEPKAIVPGTAYFVTIIWS